MTSLHPPPPRRDIAVRVGCAVVGVFVVMSACSTSHPSAAPSSATTPATTAVSAAAPTVPPIMPTLRQQGSTTFPTPITTATPATTGAPTGVPTGVPTDMLNPAVTPATIATTICIRGYTAAIRPPVNFTDSLKVHQIATYGYHDQLVRDYEEDHVIALEIGGAPAAAANLFPESHAVSSGDDTLENNLHSQVCRGALSLAEAQLRLFTAKVAHGYSRANSTA